MPTPPGRLLSGRRSVQQLEADLYETPDAYVAIFDAPGANQSDVQLKFVEGTILVRIDRFRDVYPEFEMQLGDRSMSADGRVALPADAAVDPDDAEATLTNEGTLRVRVPKVEHRTGPVEAVEAESA